MTGIPRAGHSEIGDVGRPAGKDAPVGRRDMSMRPDDGESRQVAQGDFSDVASA